VTGRRIVVLGALVGTAMTGCAGHVTVTSRAPVETGPKIVVDEDALPAGLLFLDETPRDIGEAETIVARYTVDDTLWNGDGPYLRIVGHVDAGLGERFETHLPPDAERVTLGGEGGPDAYYDVDESTDPQTMDLPEQLADLQNPWVTVSWTTGTDVVVMAQAKGLSRQQLLRVADGVHFDA